jgi:hypothetical protein
MYVQYKCERCGADVTSELEHCPKCGIELPEYTLYRDYNKEIDQELYELEHPIRAKLHRFTDPYLSHLSGTAEQEVALEESVHIKAAQILEEEGVAAYRWYKVKRKLWMILAAFVFLVWVVVASVPANYIENERIGYIIWGVLSLIPLYGVSVWLLVKGDKREIPMTQKIKRHAWGAFNKLIFSILYLWLGFYVIILFNRYFTSRSFDFIWGLLGE